MPVVEIGAPGLGGVPQRFQLGDGFGECRACQVHMRRKLGKRHRRRAIQMYQDLGVSRGQMRGARALAFMSGVACVIDLWVAELDAFDGLI